MSHPAAPPDDGRPSWAQARKLAYAASTPVRRESVPLTSVIGRTLAEQVAALCDLPHYPSSAMDGWAVRGARPWSAVDSESLSPGECRAIVTGGLVPTGATAVLRSEHAGRSREGDTDRITTNQSARHDEPRVGEHIRPAGSEARLGDILIRSGTRLNPAHVALMASSGYDDATVYAQPRVRLVLTGDEIVASGLPPRGRVRDSFGPTLPWLVASFGGVVIDSIHVADSESAVRSALADSPDGHDVIISTGGTGVSTADHLRRTAIKLGAKFIVDGIRMRPGGPSILLRLPDGRFLVGLPGNPLAAIMGLVTIAEPLLAALAGGPEPQTDRVRLGADVAGRVGTATLVPYRLENGAAVPTGWAQSAMMRGLAESVGVLVCPAGGLPAGVDAEAVTLPWRGYSQHP